MENNFWDKIENIEKMLSCWFYRYLTPYGKVTIIRTLALSQLSHIALVIPNPSKQMFKHIETIFMDFYGIINLKKYVEKTLNYQKILAG